MAARRLYGRRVSVARARLATAVFGPPRARQPRRTFVRVEAERPNAVEEEEEEKEEMVASRGGGGFPFLRLLHTSSSSTYLVNSVTIRHFLLFAK